MPVQIHSLAAASTKRYHRRVVMLCPCCNARLCDATANSQMEAYASDDEEKPPWDADVFLKCGQCKAVVEIYKQGKN